MWAKAACGLSSDPTHAPRPTQRHQPALRPVGIHTPHARQRARPGALRAAAAAVWGAGRHGQWVHLWGVWGCGCACTSNWFSFGPCPRRVASHTQMNTNGSTALHLAAERGHDPVVHLLLLHNADVFILDG